MTEYFKHLQLVKLGIEQPTGAKQKKPVKKVSEKRKVEQKEYVKIVKEMMKVSDRCEIREEGCQGKASGLHHMKKRSPATFLDKSFLKRACDSCNAWCELHPLEAIERGHSISKHKK